VAVYRVMTPSQTVLSPKAPAFRGYMGDSCVYYLICYLDVLEGSDTTVPWGVLEYRS